ncbi:MAG: YbhB/YbcL family Raf kinase inhibitor-like protein [Candidatus Paracaedibacteraceae bacterium]|nr:YbhB/YbcL family Raf kinase inhibitor-like protein [Candidatus Paracaedibacteraceae bacterium]
MPLSLTSAVFQEGEVIPSRYTCEGENISPPLQWEGVPSEVESFVLIMDDPDAPAGVWDHWILFNLPKDLRNIQENERNFSSDTKKGINSWGKLDYGGPCPPSGAHHYFFKLYALSKKLELRDASRKSEIEKAMRGHILAQAQLVGVYKKASK